MNEQEIMQAEETAIQEAKPYTLRRLQDAELFPILSIISKVCPEDLAPIFVEVATGKKGVEEIGALVIWKLIMAVVKNMNAVQDEVYTLLEGVSGIPADTIKTMEFGTTPAMLYDIVQNEKNAGFFKVLSKLF